MRCGLRGVQDALRGAGVGIAAAASGGVIATNLGLFTSLAGYGAKAPGQLEQPVEPRLGIAPGPRYRKLAVWPQLDRALQPFGIGDQSDGIGEVIIVE